MYKGCDYMGKKIIANTLLFVFMMGFIIGFNIVFGTENTLIGVTTITAVLMFLEKDFFFSLIIISPCFYYHSKISILIMFFHHL